MAQRKGPKKPQSSTEEPRAQGGIPGYTTGITQDKAKYLFNHPEEIANRINTGYGKKAPQFHAPAFEQIPGKQASGNILDNPKFDPDQATRRSGNWKFSKGV